MHVGSWAVRPPVNRPSESGCPPGCWVLGAVQDEASNKADSTAKSRPEGMVRTAIALMEVNRCMRALRGLSAGRHEAPAGKLAPQVGCDVSGSFWIIC
jgi:hypothetical protein